MLSKSFLAVAVLALLLTLGRGAGIALAGMQVPDEGQVDITRTASVTGRGEVGVVPDTGMVRLGVQTEAETASGALSENNTRMQALIDVLLGADIAAEDIQTQTVQLQPRRGEPVEPRGVQGEIIGYTATNIVEVTVRDLERLGAIIDAAVQAGGNTVQGISFRLSDPGRAVAEARRRAMQDATMAAEQLAGLAGVELGPVLTISETRDVPGVLERAVVAEVAAAPIQPGTEAVEVTVNVTWRLQ